jgi:hypothetical protein
MSILIAKDKKTSLKQRSSVPLPKAGSIVQKKDWKKRLLFTDHLFRVFHPGSVA